MLLDDMWMFIVTEVFLFCNLEIQETSPILQIHTFNQLTIKLNQKSVMSDRW